jgi:hypothetical protein
MSKDREKSGRLYTKLTRLDYEHGEFWWAATDGEHSIHGRVTLKVALDVLYRLLEIFAAGARVFPLSRAAQKEWPNAH